ncbi:MAG: cysteine desulfurase-like protein [Micrococcales bacterium]|nr:cysteine desulfurase-like protein [Micrococcales bacterium]
MSYDVESLRAQFPSLAGGTAYFDGPGGSQTPARVAEAVATTMTSPLANRGSVTEAERNAEAAVVGCREALADLVGADPRGVVVGRSMTDLTFDIARTLAQAWGPGDEVIVTRLDHDANVRPWVIAAERAGAAVRWVDFDPQTAELDLGSLDEALSERTRVVAVTAASNLLGTQPPVADIAARAHDAGALVYVDAVHYTAHEPADMAAMGADFLACSPYKFMGPHCGTVIGRPEVLEDIRPDKLLPSTDAVPERFELGTLPYELMSGVTAAVDFIADIAGGEGDRRSRVITSMEAVRAHEDRLRKRIEEGLAELPGVTVHSRAERRTPTLLVTFADAPAETAYHHLATLGVNAPASHFYAIEASRRLGLEDRGGLRIGLAPYSNDDDVDRLLEGLRSFRG